MKILAATNNIHKLEELRAILEPNGITILSAADVGGIDDVVEDADTFEGNALKKATETAKSKNMIVFADDSGLCVDALDSRPGIYSARYAGENASNMDRMNKVLGELKDKEDKTARFVCVIALASPEGPLGTARGECIGEICSAPRGDHGFGYDPIFIPKGYDKTFAELGDEVKNNLSHRGNALKKAISQKLFNF
jgi:XTP/dITP diphosphohydrolase